jgi:hypothetical protein
MPYATKLLGAMVLAAIGVCAGPASAAITLQQRRQIDALDVAMTKAGRLFQDKKLKECAAVIRDVQSKLEGVATADNPELLDALKPVYDRLEKAHALLELEGITLPPLKRPKGGAGVTIPRPTGKETVSFTKDLAPVLEEKCVGCHGRDRRVGGQLNLFTIAGLLQGGEHAAPLDLAKPAESLLILKLKGKADGDPMPLEQPPLPPPVVAKFLKWIEEGGTFDGPDPEQDLAQLAELGRAHRLPHQKLSEQRVQYALQTWALGMPGVEPDQHETRNFLMLGKVGIATLRQNGDLAEWLVAKLAHLFGAPPAGPLLKGRVTVLFFQQRSDYNAFTKAVENRDAPEESFGHWRYNVLNAYAAVLLPGDDAYTLEALIGQQVAGVYVASLGTVPRWFVEGSARAAAARLKSDDPRVIDWDRQLPDVVALQKQPDDFLTGKLPEESADIASYGFVKNLAQDTQRYQSLLESLRQGKDFDGAFSSVYSVSPAQSAADWVKRAAK